VKQNDLKSRLNLCDVHTVGLSLPVPMHKKIKLNSVAAAAVDACGAM